MITLKNLRKSKEDNRLRSSLIKGEWLYITCALLVMFTTRTSGLCLAGHEKNIEKFSTTNEVSFPILSSSVGKIISCRWLEPICHAKKNYFLNSEISPTFVVFDVQKDILIIKAEGTYSEPRLCNISKKSVIKHVRKIVTR